MSEIEENVARGIVWMNENLGADWPDFIDREALNLASPSECVLGQTFSASGDNGYHVVDQWIDYNGRWLVGRGFDRFPYSPFTAADLQAEWEKYLDAYEDGLVSPT